MGPASNSEVQVGVLVARKEDGGFAFWCFIFFTFIVFVAPQRTFAFLQPLHLAKVSIILVLVAYLYRQLSNHESLFRKTSELRLVGWFTCLAVLSIPFSIWPGGSFGVLFAGIY